MLGVSRDAVPPPRMISTFFIENVPRLGFDGQFLERKPGSVPIAAISFEPRRHCNCLCCHCTGGAAGVSALSAFLGRCLLYSRCRLQMVACGGGVADSTSPCLTPETTGRHKLQRTTTRGKQAAHPAATDDPAHLHLAVYWWRRRRACVALARRREHLDDDSLCRAALERFWLSSKQPQRLIQLKFGCNVAMDQAGADRRDRMSPLRARAPERIARRRHQ